jgi:DNA replication and repair protein RecF
VYLASLTLINFKNYSEASLQLSPGVNCFTGNNGSGKTNLIDAIYYLSFTKSYFTPSDTQNIKHNEQMFVIQGTFVLNENKEEIFCGVKSGSKKQIKRNNQEYERFSDHIGLLPVVMVAPVDQILITEGSDERRRFIDSIISQVNKTYLDNLINYNKVLAQRNAYLKQVAGRLVDFAMLEVWDEQLIEFGNAIHSVRKDFMKEFIPLFNKSYIFLSQQAEEVSIEYQSQLNADNFSNLMKQSLEKDLSFQFTTTGIHKDDLIFKLGDYPLKRIASQGQQKTYLTSLKLAQFDYLHQHKSIKPILLLDDIFDKLDDYRVKRLMQLVSKHTFGQIFITDTHPQRLRQIFEEINEPLQLFAVDKGEVTVA